MKRISDVWGVWLPCLIFVCLFLCFVATIVLRYFFRKSLSWGNELAVLCYMWIMFWGCGKAMENDEHVVFSLVYDKCSPKVQMLMKIAYNLILAVLVALAFKPSLTLMLKSTMKTGILKIPYKIAFAPFFWMLGEIIVRSLINVKKAIDEYKHPHPIPTAETELKEAEDKYTGDDNIYGE